MVRDLKNEIETMQVSKWLEGNEKRPQTQFFERDSMYRKKWQALVKSRLFLAFIISLMVGETFIRAMGSYEVYGTIRTMGGELAQMLPAALKLMVIGLVTAAWDVLLVGLWLIRGKAGSAGKGRTIGIGMVFWTYAVILALSVCGFVITLPMFTEWFPYEEIQGLPMQILYCVYAFVIVYSALVLSVVKKIWDNLNFWEGSQGPLLALVITHALIALAIRIAEFASTIWYMELAVSCILVVPLTLLILLLLRYRELMFRVSTAVQCKFCGEEMSEKQVFCSACGHKRDR